MNEIKQIVSEALMDAISEGYFSFAINPAITEETLGSRTVFKIIVDSYYRPPRVALLKFIKERLEPNHSIKCYNFETGKGAKVIVDNKVVIVAKNNKENVPTSFNLHDYLPKDYPTETVFVNPILGNVQAYTFRDVGTFVSTILKRVSDNPRFTDIQREIIRNAFMVSFNGDRIYSLEKDPRMLISFGELIVPYMVMIHAYEGFNLRGKITLRIPSNANFRKFDYMLEDENGKTVYVSSKYGDGHAQSIVSFLPNEYDQYFIEGGKDSLLKKFYELSKTCRTKPEIFWNCFLPKVTIGGREYSGSELYHLSRDFTEMTPFFEEFRRIVFTRFGDYPLNDSLKVYRNFPTSLSYLLNVVAKYEFRRDREALKGLSEINRNFPYHQVRINKKEAGLGFLKFEVQKIDENTQVKFHIPMPTCDISMHHGSLALIYND